MSCCGGGSLSFTTKRIGQWNANGNGAVATIVANGLVTPTLTGASNARAVANATLLSSTRRVGLQSAAAINSVAGVHSGQFACIPTVGTPPTGRILGGGFRAVFTFGPDDAVFNSEAKTFVGLTNSVAAPTAVDPASLTNLIGVGTDGTVSNRWQVYAAGAVAQPGTPIVALPHSGNGLYRLMIDCAAGQSAAGPVLYTLMFEDLTSGVRHVAQVSSAGNGAPGPTLGLAPRLWRATGPVNAATTQLALANVQIQTDV